jgi:hypothetical protein
MAVDDIRSLMFEGHVIHANKTWFDWDNPDFDQQDLEQFARNHPRESNGLGVEALYELAVGTYSANSYHFQASKFGVENDRVVIYPRTIGLGRIYLSHEGSSDAEISPRQHGPPVAGGERVRNAGRQGKALREE